MTLDRDNDYPQLPHYKPDLSRCDMNILEDKAPARLIQLSEKEAVIVVSLVRLARDKYSVFDPVILDVPHSIIQATATEIEALAQDITHGGCMQLSRSAAFTVRSILVALCGDSYPLSLIPNTTDDEIDSLEVRFSEIT